MDDITHFVPIAEPNAVAKIILDDAQMVPVVINVRGQVHAVAPSDNSLLAVTGGPPIDFEHQLICFDGSRRFGEPLTHLCEEENKTLSASRVVTQTIGMKHRRAPLGRLIDDCERSRRVPLLAPRRSKRDNQQDDRQGMAKDKLARIAVVLLGWCTTCESATGPAVDSFSTAELLSRPITARLLHADQFNTQYVEVRFPAGSIESVDGLMVGPQDSVLVEIEARDSQYGMTISPGTLVFSAGNLPGATFTYAVYGDRGVADGSATYPNRETYSAALDVWEQASVDRWQRATNSSTPGSDEVSGSLLTGGIFIVAALR